MQAIVEAVPMVMQWPAERDMHDSASMKSAQLIFPATSPPTICHGIALIDSLRAKVSVEHGTARNHQRLEIGSLPPPSSATVWSCRIHTTGRLHQSDFPESNPPTSMLTRLRKSMAVGRRFVSPSDITGIQR